ncbi:response regulator [Candidatus Poribacteria bacterium]|nr:response regulator [Candidatus Poribacteria bacterium]
MPKTNRILTVDDDESFLFLLKNLLSTEGYEITEAHDGLEALQIIKHDLPHLVIMDLMMPKMNGDEVVKHLRNNAATNHIPIIMISANKDIKIEVESLRHGVDEYLTKPFQPEELLARIHSILYRTYRGLDANPLTRLPGNNSIREYIEEIILKNIPFAVCYLDIDNFKAFNDKYGFEHGDRAINLAAQVFLKTVQLIGNENNFVGHIGGDDFIIITSPELVDSICQNIIKNFDESVKSLYNKDDIENGYIISVDRKGIVDKFPIMTISIGVVTNTKRKILHSVEVSEIGTELKKYAKTFKKSNYVVDIRESTTSMFFPPVKKLNKENSSNFAIYNLEKDISAIFYDVQIHLANKGWVALIFIEITPLNYLDYLKFNIWEEVLENIFLHFFNREQNIIRQQDAVSVYNNKKDKIFIYLSPSRDNSKLIPENVEKLIFRMKDYASKNIINDNYKVDLMFGYSLISFPH